MRKRVLRAVKIGSLVHAAWPSRKRQRNVIEHQAESKNNNPCSGPAASSLKSQVPLFSIPERGCQAGPRGKAAANVLYLAMDHSQLEFRGTFN
jgi:hypothetical protein